MLDSVYGRVQSRAKSPPKLKAKNVKPSRSSKTSSDKELDDHESLTETVRQIKMWLKDKALLMQVGDQGNNEMTEEFGDIDVRVVHEVDMNGDHIIVLEADKKEPEHMFVQVFGDWQVRYKAAHTFLGNLNEQLVPEF